MSLLESLGPYFQGLIPCAVATCSRDGIPNITYVSHVYVVDAKHVAVSRQFFNKTTRNIDESPFASVLATDPRSLQAYQLKVRFARSETTGPLFDTMSDRLEAIASHTGMVGVFKLLSADVFEVLSVEAVEGFLEAPDPASASDEPPLDASGPMNELRGLQILSDRMNRARCLDDLLDTALAAMDEVLGFRHSMVLLPDESGARLETIASRGYGDEGIGAGVPLGEGLIGTVAARRHPLRISGVADLRYGRAIRDRVKAVHGSGALLPEIPLPGLEDAQTQLALPLVVEDRLVGVLAVESPKRADFQYWHDAFLQIVGNQLAFAIDRLSRRERDEGDDPPCEPLAGPAREGASSKATRSFCLYKNDDCVFVDGEYLIRNVPGRILWKLLRSSVDLGRTEFSNRELRLDPSLGLPSIKDNLESRLILLRKRLEQKCPDVQLVRTGRGRFALRVDCRVELVERDSA